MNEELLKKIISILTYSDIVWPKYGSQTIEELAREIAQIREIAQTIELNSI
jgi:hypothetical protein